MTTYGFKYNGEGETTYYNTIEGVSLDMLIIGKYYSRDGGVCYLYVGTSTEETSELTFNCVGGPYDDSICLIESQFVYHFVDGECDTKIPTHFYYRNVSLNHVQIEPEINKYYSYHNPKAVSVDKCYLYLGKVLEDKQLVLDTLFLTSEHNNCGCFDLTLSYEFYDCISGQKLIFDNVNLNSAKLIQNKFYKGINDVCYQFLGRKQEQGSGTLNIKEGPFEDCDCGNEPPTPPEPPKPTIKKRVDNIEYYEKINCEFADAVYNKAMSDRYGVEFCCEKDLQRLTIKKKLLDAGQLQDDIDLCEL